MTFKRFMKGTFIVFLWIVAIIVVYAIADAWRPSTDTKLVIIAVMVAAAGGKLFERLDSIRDQLADIERRLEERGFD